MRIAILTTPAGLLTTKFLAERLCVVGILIDDGGAQAAAYGPPAHGSRWPRTWSGWRWFMRRGVQKLVPWRFPLQWSWHRKFAAAQRAEDRFLRQLDRLFIGYPFHQRRLAGRRFLRWEELAALHNVPVVHVENINDERSAQTLRSWNVDLGLVVGGRIIQPHIINIPRLGLLNKHSSLLPKHRGWSGEYWCLFYEDFESLGVTVHYIEPRVDRGNIVVQKRLSFAPGDTPTSLRFKSELLGAEAFVEAVTAIAATGTKGVAQDESLATTNRKPTLQSDAELYAKLPRLWAHYAAPAP